MLEFAGGKVAVDLVDGMTMAKGTLKLKALMSGPSTIDSIETRVIFYEGDKRIGGGSEESADVPVARKGEIIEIALDAGAGSASGALLTPRVSVRAASGGQTFEADLIVGEDVALVIA